jgi:hypothetical protein
MRVLSRGKSISDRPSGRSMCRCTDIMFFLNPPYMASRQLLIPRIAAAGTSLSPLPCQALHGYMVTSAHRVEVEVGADGPASAFLSGAAAAAPPAGAITPADYSSWPHPAPYTSQSSSQQGRAYSTIICLASPRSAASPAAVPIPQPFAYLTETHTHSHPVLPARRS